MSTRDRTRRRSALRGAAGRLRTGAVLALVTGVLVSGCEFDGAYDLPLPGSAVDEERSFLVTAEFDDVLNVVPRSPVMVDDVPVGEVTEVDLDRWHAVVTLRVRDDVELPDDVTAQIQQTSLLGEKYVALEAPRGGGRGRLGEGDEIPLSATGRNPEVEEVLGALSFLLSGGGVGQLATISKELNDVMSGRTDRLRHLLGSLDSVVGTIDQQKGDIIRAMESMNRLARTLNKEKRTIAGALDVMGPAVAVLSAQHAELMRMLRSLDRLGRVGARVINASREDLLDSLRHLEPVLKQLNAAGDSLPRGLSLMVSFPFPQEASEVVKGDFANTEIRADISLENLDLNLPELPEPPDLPDPEVPIPPLPDPDDLIRCLRSQDLTSAACRKFLTDANLFAQLKKMCRKERWRDNPVCRAVDPLPDLDPGGDGGGGAGGGDGGGILPDLPFTRGGAARAGTRYELYGGAR